MYGGESRYNSTFLTLALDEGEWSIPPPKELPQSSAMIVGWMGCRSDLDAVERSSYPYSSSCSLLISRKGKTVLMRGRERSRLLLFYTVSSQMMARMSPPFTPWRIPGTDLVWVDPKALVQLKGIGQLKNPVTLSGIKPAAFRLVI
jgi:hypothetical protein